MIKAYPVQMLHEMGDIYNENEKKMIGVGKSGSIYRVPQRNCDINIGTAESTESSRSGDYNLVHLSEVGLWKATEKSSPEDIVRSATTGVLYLPDTMIVYESTPNGVGNFSTKSILQRRKASRNMSHCLCRISRLSSIDLSLPTILRRRNLPVGCISTEIMMKSRAKEKSQEHIFGGYGRLVPHLKTSIGTYRSEPSSPVMATWHQSTRVTTSRRLPSAEEKCSKTKMSSSSGDACRPPRWKGEIYGNADEGEEALEGLRFRKEDGGRLYVWHDVEKDSEEEEILDRYLVIVDVCKGHTKNADFADILVLDRLYMMDGEQPVVAAEWHGHIDMKKLAWKAAQVAAYYNNAKLVIESNTLETNRTDGEAEYILTLIADVYDNLYARKQSAEDIREKRPTKYGFHTNRLTKPVIILNLQTAVREHLYIERESECLDEYITYIETENGGYEAMEGYHDDRLMTRAIGLQVCFHEMDLPRVVKHDRFKKSSTNVVSEATI